MTKTQRIILVVSIIIGGIIGFMGSRQHFETLAKEIGTHLMDYWFDIAWATALGMSVAGYLSLRIMSFFIKN